MTGLPHKSAMASVDPAGRASTSVRGTAKSSGPQHPDPAACGTFGIRIARDGRWFYHGSPIDRKPLVRLFASVLRRDDDGAFWLVTPAERGRIEVEDAPFVAVAVAAEGAGREQRLRFRTNLDEEVTADAGHAIRVTEQAVTREPAPYVLVRDRLEARIARPVFYELVELGVEELIDGAPMLGVWSAGRFFALGRPT